METEKEIDYEHLYSEDYCVRNNCLYRLKRVKNKKEPELCLLCNFVPYIEKQITLDDGERAVIRVKIAAIAESGRKLPTVEMSIDELTNPNWAAKTWGSECSLEVGSSVKEYIRHAVQSTAKHAEKVTVYSITGWKEIDGKYYFLMPGDDDKTVTLPNKMSGYKMQRECTDAEIAQAYSLLTDTLAPKAIMYPLLAITFTSPLNCFLREAGCEPKTVIMLIGKTGSKKSTLAALMLSFFGTFTASTLPLSFKDTANSIMHHSFAMKDVLTCIDDFHPSGRGDESNMTNTMQMILRAYGDRVGRGRLTSASEAMETRYPQGNAIITAEFPPDTGESGTARYFAVEMSPDSLNNSFLSLYQEEASKGKLNACMFAFTEWMRKEYLQDCKLKKEWVESLHKRHITCRDDITKRLTENRITFHPRIPEDVAVMRIGFESFLQFIKAHGMINDEDEQRYLKDFDDVMYAVAVSQSRSVEQDKPVYKYICKFASLLDSGRYFVIPKTCGHVEKNNNCLGYEDDDNYYLFKTQTHQAVKKLCDEQGEVFTIKENALAKALLAEGLVLPGEKQVTRPVRIDQDTLVRLLVIPKERMREIVERFS